MQYISAHIVSHPACDEAHEAHEVDSEYHRKEALMDPKESMNPSRVEDNAAAESSKYDKLKLENQLCFPLYACSKEIIRRYKPFLSKLNLTYTQYITMMVLWEERELSVKELGRRLFLDSGTLTPLLKKLEEKKYLTRTRDANDERNLIIRITKEGLDLREDALAVPNELRACVKFTPEDSKLLYRLLYSLLSGME